MSKTPYNQIDHSHCWTSDSPPCGQKIKHFKCCLCEKLHPNITELTATTRELRNNELKEEIETRSADKAETLQRLGHGVPPILFEKKEILNILSQHPNTLEDEKE